MSESHNNNSWWIHSNFQPDNFRPAVKAMCPWLWTAFSPLEFSHLCTGTHWVFNSINDGINAGLRGFPRSEGLAPGSFSSVSRQLNIPSKLLIVEKRAGLWSLLLKRSGWQKAGTWNLDKNPGQKMRIVHPSTRAAATLCDHALTARCLATRNRQKQRGKSHFVPHFSLQDSSKALGLFEILATTWEDLKYFLHSSFCCRSALHFLCFGMAITTLKAHKSRSESPHRLVWGLNEADLFTEYYGHWRFEHFYQLIFWQLSGCHCHSQHISGWLSEAQGTAARHFATLLGGSSCFAR